MTSPSQTTTVPNAPATATAVPAHNNMNAAADTLANAAPGTSKNMESNLEEAVTEPPNVATVINAAAAPVDTP